MFSHRGLFLGVTISLASIVLAGVQPAHQHQYDSNPRYLQHQSVSQHWIRSPTEQYRAEQLPDQESTRYLPEVKTQKNEDPKEARRKKIEEYGRKMDFIRHMDGGRSLQALMVHNRRKRSDPASIEWEDFWTSILPRFLLSKLSTNIADVILYLYPYMTARVKNITVLQAIITALAHLLEPLISDQRKEITNMSTAEPSQDKTLQKPDMTDIYYPSIR
ncbi:uncharacterized protein [Temnothorax nylanderi]|uniref:uncharacterized protein n=1 Tax=Temnothorax nylanderi TaxID=102681 RepID=UPI003A8A778F